MDSELIIRGKGENTNMSLDPWYRLDSGDFHAVKVYLKCQVLLVNTRQMNYFGM